MTEEIEAQIIKAREILEKVFGFSRFRPGQEDILQDILHRKDVVIVMPTGGGKSLLYQLPAVMWEGTVLVISPLISLMKDQVDALQARNIPAIFINSSLNGEEKRIATQAMQAGYYRLVYVSPERLQYREFQESLQRTQISMLAVDEAHCISQWGYDFRPDYLKIKEIRELLGCPQTVALTATATEEVRKEIAENLGLKGWHGHVAGFNRENLYLEVRQVCGQQDKIAHIREIYSTFGPSGIVYASTRKNVEYIAQKLYELEIVAAPYHAGMKDEIRSKIQNDFMSGKAPVVVATNAFGMGIDKRDIRFVVHFDMPATMESYYQEIGRAGRDGQPSHCALLFNYADTRIPRFFIEESHPSSTLVKMVLQAIQKNNAVPDMEQLATLPGIKSQMTLRYILNLLEQSGIITRTMPGEYSISYNSENMTRLNAVLRLDQGRKNQDEKKLEKMISYSYYKGCHRNWILSYFGDHTLSAQCNGCDNCVKLPAKQEIQGNLLIEVLKALSAVARLNGRFGKNLIAEVLVGSKSKKITELELYKIPTYSALDYMTIPKATKLLDILIEAGYIQIVLKDGQYPLLNITRHGYEVMMRKIPCYLPHSFATIKKEIPERGKKQKQSIPAEKSYPDQPVDEELYEKLSQRRREIAQALGKPAFIVFSNTVLKEMAQYKPKTREELSQISGVGKFKLNEYGEQFLEILQQYE